MTGIEIRLIELAMLIVVLDYLHAAITRRRRS
jgi:hypothetical protein